MVIAVIRASLGFARKGNQPTSNAMIMRIELRQWLRASMLASLGRSVWLMLGWLDRTPSPDCSGVDWCQQQIITDVATFRLSPFRARLALRATPRGLIGNKKMTSLPGGA